MLRKLIRGLGFSLASLLLVSAALFAVIHLAPGDVAEIHNLSPVTAAGLHLDRSLPVQYLFWLGNCLRLDFGVSLRNGTPVISLLRDYAPPTLFLTFGSLCLSLLLAVPIGLYRGLRPASRLGKLLGAAVYAVSSVPAFVLGYVALAIIFGIFHAYTVTPPEGPFRFWKWAAYYLPPLAVLAVGNGSLSEFTRFISLEAQQVDSSPFLRAARARGAPLWRHFLRCMLAPVFNVTATHVAMLLGGLVVVERVFNFHGLGWLSWEATLNRDFPVLMGLALGMAVLVRLLLFLNEWVAAWLDPRLRQSP